MGPIDLTSDERKKVLDVVGMEDPGVEILMTEIARYLHHHRRYFETIEIESARTGKERLTRIRKAQIDAAAALEELGLLSMDLLFHALEGHGYEDPESVLIAHQTMLEEIAQACADAIDHPLPRGNRQRVADVQLITRLALACARSKSVVPAVSRTSRFYRLATAILNMAGSNVTYPDKTIRAGVANYESYAGMISTRSQLK